VGWNIVTTADAVASLNFGMTEMPSSDLRYEMAADFTAAISPCGIAGTTAPWWATSAYEWYRQQAEAAAQRSRPQPVETVPQTGSMEWAAEQKKSR
jgi:alkanesulfonate monooxygenase SsuD/methylene tetrahydromethanopterin reductase-like flavin-dependent oxidoreductase (luciferase family)